MLQKISAISMIAAFVTACADEPRRVPAAAPENPVVGLYVADPSQNVVTITDHNTGNKYTLNVERQEVRYSDGRILSLTPDQTIDFATTFHGILAADRIVADVQSRTGPNCSTLPQDDPRCSTRLGVEPYSHAVYNSTPAVFALAQGGDMCNRIMTDVIGSLTNYGRSRTNWLNELIGMGAAETVNGVVKITIPVGSAVASKLALFVADQMHARIQLGFMVALFNSHHCSDRELTAGPIFTSSGGTSDFGTVILYCWEVTEAIKWTDGKIYPIRVRYCEYRVV